MRAMREETLAGAEKTPSLLRRLGPKLPRVYYVCANRRNIGDYCSMLGVRKMVGARGRVQFIEVGNGTLDRFFRGLTSEDVLIIGGGGLLADFFAPFWQILLEAHERGRWRFCLFGVGVCSHKGRDTVPRKPLLKRIVTASMRSYLRPPIPYGLETCPSVELTCCPSIAHVCTENLSRVYRGRSYLLYVEHRHLVSQSANRFLRIRLAEVCKAHSLQLKVHNNISLRRSSLLRLYENAAYIVTTRLHGYLFGAFLRRPTLAFSADRKLEGFQELFGMSNVYDLEKIYSWDWDACLNRMEILDVDTGRQLLKKVNSHAAELAKLIGQSASVE